MDSWAGCTFKYFTSKSFEKMKLNSLGLINNTEVEYFMTC